MAKQPSYGDKRGKFITTPHWVSQAEEDAFNERLEQGQEYPEGQPLNWKLPVVIFILALVGMCALTFSLPPALATVAFFATPFVIFGMYVFWMIS